ncbi:RuBisCO large subunit C-terminal-like domain-containing protein [Inmirania thermothiophila]|uniref:Ribulose-bisphosphate carboxylase large chain n=1 Tax=Inmirania thermothiophila TaxID=1750597 RepID=A0A3N1Y126_9GAMM|nr:RuBisCO large subunit C-terminal-like domain-containing protein [Inmirania thermothiophila]ROR32241.1 ribulose-bisphosphate carboxylase large chain [Inmirania thermothiophila]
MSREILVTYELAAGDAEEAAARADAIAHEQTVELSPRVLGRFPAARGMVGGRVDGPHAAGPGRWRVTVAYPAEVVGSDPPQLLNLLWGNVSLLEGVVLAGLALPEGVLRGLGGPRYGIEGLRQLTGVYGRPLAATALKPVGLDAVSLAAIAEAFVEGGGDLVKDDHGLADQATAPFEERVARCQEAVERAAARTGRRALYLPAINAAGTRLEAQLEYAVRAGVRGVLVSPAILGLERMRWIAASFPLVVLAHPAMTGGWLARAGHGIEHGLLLGTLFRLFGADAAVFPDAGGRFGFTPAQCERIAGALREPLGPVRAAMPVPAGGMALEDVPALVRRYGEDAILLIGGAVLGSPDEVRRSAARFAEALGAQAAAGGARTPSPAPSRGGAAPAGAFLAQEAPFRWAARRARRYKEDGQGRFRDVQRFELVGQHGESTAFELRYFEIGPGGYTTLEAHVHEHAIIGARGRGRVRIGEEEFEIGPHDVAYVAPLGAHQLRNEGGEPFGFYCIVDRRRDRPRPLDPAAQPPRRRT